MQQFKDNYALVLVIYTQAPEALPKGSFSCKVYDPEFENALD